MDDRKPVIELATPVDIPRRATREDELDRVVETGVELMRRGRAGGMTLGRCVDLAIAKQGLSLSESERNNAMLRITRRCLKEFK
jgi:hypothetical protein